MHGLVGERFGIVDFFLLCLHLAAQRSKSFLVLLGEVFICGSIVGIHLHHLHLVEEALVFDYILLMFSLKGVYALFERGSLFLEGFAL